MLQAIRDKAQGWIAWAIVFLISVPFALWGIQEYLGVGSEPAIASVDGQDITEQELDNRFRQFRQDLRERLGDAYRPEMFDDEQLRKEVLEDMIDNSVVLQASLDMGLRAGDLLVREMILQQESFQRDGVFDREAYERAVRLQGETTSGFEERIRRYLVSNQLSIAVSNSSFVTDHELQEAIRLVLQKREIAYFVVPMAEFVSEEPVSEDEMMTYYEANRAQFKSPEQVKLDYIKLDSQNIGAQLEEPTEEELAAYYENQKAGKSKAERRRVSHILIAVEDMDKDDEALAKINEIQAKIKAGESFEELAKTESQDPGSAVEGGDLGYFEKGIMDPAFERAAFALESDGEVSQPIRSDFGYHLIKLTGIEGVTLKPLEEVRDEMMQELRRSKAENIFFEYAERLSDRAFESPDSLEPAAEALGIKVQSTGWLTRNSQQELFAYVKVRNAAFSEDVLGQGNNSELIELDNEEAVVIRIREHQEASTLPFEDVKLRIEDRLRIERAEKLATDQASKQLERLRSGESLEQVAGKYQLERPDAIQRNGSPVPRALSDQVFKQPKPEGLNRFAAVRLDNGDQAVFELITIKDGSTEGMDKQQLERERANLQRLKGRDYFERLVADLRSRANVVKMQ